MSEKKGMNPIIKLSLILFAVSALTSGILGSVNAITEDRIDEQTRLATAKAYNEVLPYDGEYEAVSYDEGSFVTVKKLSKAGDMGYVAELTFSGAQGSITAAFGVGNDGKITGASVISHGETPSLGARITEDWFREGFVGQAAGMSLKKNGGSVDAITSATISSQAMVDAANTAIAVVASLG